LAVNFYCSTLYWWLVAPSILFIFKDGCSELRVEDLRGDLTDAVTNITEVFAVDASESLSDTVHEIGAIGDSQTESARCELSILLVVVELSELTGNSVKMREVAEGIEEGLLLLQFLGGNSSLHYLGGIVDLAILNYLKSIVDHSPEGGLALEVASEGAAGQESSQEVFKHVNLGEICVLV